MIKILMILIIYHTKHILIRHNLNKFTYIKFKYTLEISSFYFSRVLI